MDRARRRQRRPRCRGVGRRVGVPPDAPAYQTAPRLADPEEEAGYYGGFSNEGLWPLCHMAHVKPVFRSEDWAAYQAVNRRFAEAIVEELADPAEPVFIQDYHLALVAGYLRAAAARARRRSSGTSPGRIRIASGCVRGAVNHAGLLANDLVAFQVDRDRRNFVGAVREELGAEIDGSVVRSTATSRASPRCPSASTTIASAAWPRTRRCPRSRPAQAANSASGRRARRHRRRSSRLHQGHPRTARRRGPLLAATRPRGRFVFVQVGVPSRSKLKSYSDIEREIDARVARDQRAPRPGSGRRHRSGTARAR